MSFQTMSSFVIEQAEKGYMKEHLQLPGINSIDLNRHLPSISDVLGDIPVPPVQAQLYSTYPSLSPRSWLALPLPQPSLGSREVSIDCAKTTVRSLLWDGFGPNSKTHHAETVLSRPANSILQVGPNNDNRPSIYTICRIVYSRTPKTVSESWFPRGLFKEKSLKELLKELPVGESKGLIFTNSLPLDEDMPTEQYRHGVSLGGFRDGVRVRG